MDVVAWRESQNGKPYAVRCGSAVPSKKGGWNLYLDAMPAPVDGQYRLSIVPQREQSGGGRGGRDDGGAESGEARQEETYKDGVRQRSPRRADLDDGIPF